MADITQIYQSLSPSIEPLMRFFSGLSYIVGIWLMWVSIKKTKTIADFRARSPVSPSLFIPLSYFLGGVALIYLPTFVTVLTNTLYGDSAPMAYASWIPTLVAKYFNPINALKGLVTLAGVIWVVRGIVLMVQASEPGGQQGQKGLLFFIAGVFALNLNYTVNALSYIITSITTWTT